MRRSLHGQNDLFKCLHNILHNSITWQLSPGQVCAVHGHSFKKIGKFEPLIRIRGFCCASNTGMDL